MTSIGNDLSVFYCDNLIDLTGIENLTSVGGLAFDYNSMLTSIASLSNLTTIEGSCTFVENSMLTNLSGLENITFIEYNLHIQNNDALVEINSLQNITSIHSIHIVNNESLQSINLESLDLTGSVYCYLV